MVKSILHKSFSIALSFLVLFSTVSLTIEKHFCGDTLVAVSIFTEVEKCAMEASELEQAAITKKSCCKDQVNVIQGQEVLSSNTFEDLDLEQQQFLVTFTHSYFSLFEINLKQFIPHKEYSPPYIVEDIQLLNDTFLI